MRGCSFSSLGVFLANVGLTATPVHARPATKVYQPTYKGKTLDAWIVISKDKDPRVRGRAPPVALRRLWPRWPSRPLCK